MNIIAFAGCAVIVCALTVTLRQYKPDIAMLASLAGGAVLLAIIIKDLSPVLSELNGLISGTWAGDCAGAVFKAFGICLVAQLAADVCRDSGQQTLAARVEMAGRIGILIAALPLLTSVLEVSVGIIKG